MNLQSVKTRFMGSYLSLLALFVIQIPIIYLLVSSMGEKYSQVETAGGLRKRAIEITEILSRHIMTGDERLEEEFQAKRKEYRNVIESLRKGSGDMAAITDPEILGRLDSVEREWNAMDSTFDKAMESGDRMRILKGRIEDTTGPMVDRVVALINAYYDLKDSSYNKNVEFTAQRRMMTVKLSYLAERYMLEDSKSGGTVGAELAAVIGQLDDGFATLRHGGAALGIRPPKGEKIGAALKAAEESWKERKEIALSGIKSKDEYGYYLNELLYKHTPQVLAAADGLTKSITANAKSNAVRSIVTMAVSIIISVIIAVIFMWSTNKLVIKPIMRVKEIVEDFAGGDLTKRADIKIKFMGKEIKDEIASLGESVDDMASQMSKVLGRITDSSGLLASASEQLSSSSTQISEGATRQSAQATQVATAMEEMNATVIEVAKNSQQVAESARGAQAIASKGGSVVKQAISAMKEVAESTSVTADTIKRLGKSSEEIGTIVSVINDIADQTNLLALNAAIEAARAGEQGRGFAVVADEVRKLAERTTKATKEISDMIRSIQDETGRAVTAMADGTVKVENGVKLANEAGDALGQIVVGVQNVTDMINHIATSTEEQSATTDEISKNMDSIADVARTNVSAIGEVSKATGEMARLASELKELVSNFSISKEASVSDIRAASDGRALQLHVVGGRKLAAEA